MNKSKFVNGNRTKEERRILYCSLRKIFNLTTYEARTVVVYRKTNMIRYLEQKQLGGLSYDRLR